MKMFFGTSVGNKLIAGLTGLFLIIFLAVHLVVNLTLLGGSEIYNTVAHWMGTNPAIRVMQPVLALGLLLHIIYTACLSIKNLKTRTNRYHTFDPAGGSTWASRNMFVLGLLIILFLLLHLSSFSLRMKFGSVPYADIPGVAMKDVYTLVTARFSIWWYVILYVISMVLLFLHLAHGFQSSLQTLGLSDHRWRKIWNIIGIAYAIVISVGFAILPVFFFIKSQMGGVS